MLYEFDPDAVYQVALFKSTKFDFIVAGLRKVNGSEIDPYDKSEEYVQLTEWAGIAFEPVSFVQPKNEIINQIKLEIDAANAEHERTINYLKQRLQLAENLNQP